MTIGSRLGTARDDRDEVRGTSHAHGSQRRRHRRQLGVDDLAEDDVVEPDDAHIGRHVDPRSPQPLDHTDRQDVVVGDDRRGGVGQHLGGDVEPSMHRRGVARPDPAHPHLEIVGRLAQRLPAHAVGPAGLGTRDVGDRVVPQLGEMLDRAPGSAGVVGDDARHLWYAPVEDDHRLLLRDHPDRAVRHPRAREQDAVDRAQLALGPVAFQLRVLPGVRQQDHVASRTRRLVGSPDQLGVERVRDISDDEGQAAGARSGQPRQC
jgi:hypothetical protein